MGAIGAKAVELLYAPRLCRTYAGISTTFRSRTVASAAQELTVAAFRRYRLNTRYWEFGSPVGCNRAARPNVGTWPIGGAHLDEMFAT